MYVGVTYGYTLLTIVKYDDILCNDRIHYK